MRSIMSNCYSEACFIIPDVTPQQLERLSYFENMDPDEHDYTHDELAMFDDPDYPCLGFQTESTSDGGIYVQGHGENFDIENAATILHHVFFAPDQPDREPIIISMAYWSDKCRPDNFGGVGAKLTREGIQWVNTCQF
jgi:hypothetical protein